MTTPTQESADFPSGHATKVTWPSEKFARKDAGMVGCWMAILRWVISFSQCFNPLLAFIYFSWFLKQIQGFVSSRSTTCVTYSDKFCVVVSGFGQASSKPCKIGSRSEAAKVAVGYIIYGTVYIYICIAPDLLSKQPEYIKLMLDLPRSRIID